MFDTAHKCLLWSLGLMVTAYLVLLAKANPSPVLLAALAMELSFFVLLIVVQKQKKIVIDVLIETTRSLNQARTIFYSSSCKIEKSGKQLHRVEKESRKYCKIAKEIKLK